MERPENDRTIECQSSPDRKRSSERESNRSFDFSIGRGHAAATRVGASEEVFRRVDLATNLANHNKILAIRS